MLFLFIMRSNIRIFLCLCLISAGNISFGQSKEIDIIKEFVSDPSLAGASSGIMVCDPVSGEPLLVHNASTLLAPASVLKLVTSATALEILGPDYRFSTTLLYSGQIDTIRLVLKGDLIVRGGGDPTLGSAFFEDVTPPEAFAGEWISDIRKSGIKEITGNLLMDASAFPGMTVPGSWSWDDIGNYYGAAPSPLTVFDNMIRLYFDSPVLPGEPVILSRTEPATPGIVWQSEVKSSAVNRDLAYVFGSPWGEKRIITGTIPGGRKNFVVKAAMPDPPLMLGFFLKQKLDSAGIVIRGEVKVITEKADGMILSVIKSPPLSEILRVLNHESVNLFADHLVYQIELEKSGRGSLENGLELIHRFWKDYSVRDTFFIHDGSGLSRFNAISAQQIIQVLGHMLQSSNRDVFLGSLPVAGKGTLSSFSTSAFPGQSLRCKSGSIDKVRCYAGYLQCDSGREVAFAILVNNYASGSAEMGRKLQKLLLGIKKKL
jgi:D-alanyl-D-alanine carboxypeptidase/D-alanyl-D-alanine-endopeptidase (penicillin-binding protein 4)